MASGVGDSANVLYYSNVNYNSTNAPISSYVMTNLGSRFLNQQSNYEVAINKLKVSSLEGVRMGYFDSNKYQLGLELTDSGGTDHFVSSYVNLPNATPSTAYYEYYVNLDRNYNVNLYKGSGSSVGSLQFSFVPRDSAGVQITPFYAVYNPLQSIYWVVNYRGVYVFNENGVLQATKTTRPNIRCASFSTTAQHMVVCQNYPSASTQEIFSYSYSAGQINDVGAFGLNKEGQPLTDIRCAATDGTTLIAVWNNTDNNSFYTTTYNYKTYAAENEGQMDTNITNPISVLVNTIDNSFVIVNDNYDELKQLSANVQPSWNPAQFSKMVNVRTGNTMFDNTSINPLYDIHMFQSLDSTQTLFASTTILAVLKNEFQPSIEWDNIGTQAYQPTNVPGNPPFTFTIYPTSDNMPLLIGINDDGLGNNYLTTIGANGSWVSFYQLPTTYGQTCQISANVDGVITLTFNGSLYKFSVVPTYTPGTAPYLSIPAGADFVQVAEVGTSTPHTIQSFVWDNLLPNIGYCLVLENSVIYKVCYNIQANSISLLEWHSDANTYNGYLVKCWQYANQVNSADITKFNISSFTQLATFNIANTYASNLQISRELDLFYVPNTTNQMVSQYDYLTFAAKGTITGFDPFACIGVFTGSEIVPPSLANQAYYDLQEIVNAVNAALASCYATLQGQITGTFPIASVPYFTLNYTTHLLTLNYDPKTAQTGNGVYLGNNLIRYFLFASTAGSGLEAGFNKLILTPTGSITQSKETIYQLNTVDKLIIKTNMSLLTDFTGSDTNTTIFTDLDFDTQNAFFNMSGDFIYSAILLRNYAMISNQQLRSISYQLFIAYLDGSETELLIPPQQNASIKFQFTRIY
jgi:hypothetical protein